MQNEDRSSNPTAGAQEIEPQNHKYDTLTNLEMLDEIDRMVADDDEETMDTDKILAYLDLLQERAPVAEDCDPKLAWEVFKQNNASLLEDDATDTTAEQVKVPVQRKPRFRRLIGGIAAAAALICMLTVVSSASFRTWVREAYEDSFVYRFFNSEETPEVLPDYEITELPEGYELSISDVDDISGIKLYSYGESQINFMYCYANDTNNILMIPVNDSSYRSSLISISGRPADFYTSLNEDAANMLLLIDEDENIAFLISCRLEQDAIIKMAESISITSH